MANPVVIELDKPENLKDGFKLSIKDVLDKKAGVEMNITNILESKVGKQVNIQSKLNPKTW